MNKTPQNPLKIIGVLSEIFLPTCDVKEVTAYMKYISIQVHFKIFFGGGGVIDVRLFSKINI